MATSISYNSLSLQSSTYRVEKIEHTEAPARQLNSASKARANGESFVSALYKARRILVKGHIIADSAAAFVTALDALQAKLNSTGANLDIGYGSGTRRYASAVCIRQALPKEAHHFLFAPFELEFYIPDGVGVATSGTTEQGTNVASAALVQALTLTGSADQLPVITVTFDSATDATILKIKNDTTGEELIIGPSASSFAAADVVEVDCANMTVKINGVLQDYTGIFPRWLTGANTMRISVTSTAHQYDWSFVYTPRYL